MAKKQDTAVVPANARTVRAFDFTEADSTAAQQLGIMVGGSAGDRISRAVTSYNMAARLAVESGYLLLSVKAELAHGEFERGVEDLGLSPRRAQELMAMAKFTTALPEDRRVELLSLPKTKVLALASADAEVLDQLLEEGDVSDLDDLSVRDLRLKIRGLQADATDMAVQRDKAEADLKAMEKKAKRAERDAEDDVVPLVVADLRAELAALIKKAELSVTSLYPLGSEILNLVSHAEAMEWIEPTLRLGLAGLLSLRELVDGNIKSFAEAMHEKGQRLASQPDALSFLDASEIKTVAGEYARLTALHQHEAALREHERAQSKPKGKGRPSSAPVAPKA